MKNTWQTSELILKLQLQHLWQASLSQPMLAGSQDLLKLYLSPAKLEGGGGLMGLPPLARLGEFIIRGIRGADSGISLLSAGFVAATVTSFGLPSSSLLELHLEQPGSPFTSQGRDS